MTFGGSLDDEFYDALLDDDAEELYEHAPCGYLSLLPDGTIVKLNRTFTMWTGYEWGDVVGRRRFSELLSRGDRIYYETHVAPMLHMQGQVREIAVDLLLAAGDRLPVIVNAVMKTNALGEPMFTRVAMFDATERRSYERELLDAQRAAADSERRAVALARTLQASLLPPTIVVPPWLDVGAAYRPAGDGSVVGGDFYDVFEMVSGTVAIVLGDVAGKGAEAAVLTSLARHTVRTETLRRRRAADVLSTVAGAFNQYHHGMYCTAVLLFVEAGPAPTAHIAVGGHHLPVRRRAHGEIDRVGEPGQLLGLIEDPRVGETAVTLEPGDQLVLFTDGVVEARRDEEWFGDEGLLAVVGEAGRQADAQALADAVVSAALEFQSGRAQDDIAVVVVRLADSPPDSPQDRATTDD